MARQASSAHIFRNLLLIFLSFFAVFALLNTGLSFIYQPLFALLISVPTFTTLALFALIMTLVIRQNCMEEVPGHMIGLVTYSDGTLKALAPAGPAWVWFGSEHLSGFLSLEPVSIHAPLPGLRSGDGIELAPLVTIITWRVHASITTLLDSQFRQEVLAVATESQGKRERRVRDQVAEVMGRRVAAATLEELEAALPGMLYNSFGQEVIEEANQSLTPIGLHVEALECIGSITLPTKASAAVKTIGAARRKLEHLLRANASDAARAEGQAETDKLLRHARRAVQEMQAASRAVDDYVQAVIDVFQHAPQHFNAQAGIKATVTAQQAQSERLTELAAEINALLEAASELKSAGTRAGSAQDALTRAELDTLFKVLEAIEQKKLPLGAIFA